jgi:hypothetical protein
MAFPPNTVMTVVPDSHRIPNYLPGRMAFRTAYPFVLNLFYYNTAPAFSQSSSRMKEISTAYFPSETSLKNNMLNKNLNPTVSQ